MQRFRVPGHDAVANLVLDDVQDSTCTCRVQHVCVCDCCCRCVRAGIPPRPRRPIQGAIIRCLELAAAGPWCSLPEVSDETRSLGLVVARGTSEAASAFHSPTVFLRFEGHAYLSGGRHRGDCESFRRCLGRRLCTPRRFIRFRSS